MSCPHSPYFINQTILFHIGHPLPYNNIQKPLT
nr:MAG TPA: hypothetical protein [Caudoviricetes sp.]